MENEIENKEIIKGEKIVREYLNDVLWNKYLNQSERLREAIVLWAEGKSKADIARKFGITRGAVTQYFNGADVKEIANAIRSSLMEKVIEETALRKAEDYLFGISELKKLYNETKDWEQKLKAIKEILKESRTTETKPQTTNQFIDKAVQFSLPE